MSTTTVGAGQSGEAATGAISQQKTTYRRYIKRGTTDDGAGNITTIISKSSILGETDKKEPEKIKTKDASGNTVEVPNPHAGMSTSWADAERDGFEVFNENDIVGYSVKSWEGAELLNPDPAMRLYIYNRGLATFQTSVANALMKSLKENTTELEPEFNGVTVDLRVGTDEEGNYSINKAPTKRAVSDEDKLVKLLKATGKTDEQIAMILQVINASSATPAASGSAAVEEEQEVA